MGTGESGANGVNVLRHVKKDSNQGNENAPHQLRSMAERNAMVMLVKHKFATKMFPVQVSLRMLTRLVSCPFCHDVGGAFT